MSSTSRQFNQVQVTRVYSPKLTHSGLLVNRAISTTNFLLPNIKTFTPPPPPFPLLARHKTLINRLLHRDLHQCASYTPIESHKGGACCDRLAAKRRRLLFFFLRLWVIQPITLSELTAYRPQFTNGVAVECSIWSISVRFIL